MRFAAAAEDGAEKNAGEEAEEDMTTGATERAPHTGSDAWVDGSPWQAYPDGGGAGAPYDAYFFGCGASHRACLGDFAALSGAVPIPPKQTMGVWWSKYEEELKGILEYTNTIFSVDEMYTLRNERACALHPEPDTEIHTVA